MSEKAYSSLTGPMGVSATTPAPYPYPCPGLPRVPPGSPSTETPLFKSEPMSKKTHPLMESGARGTATSADPTMNLRPVPTPPSGYPRTELAPPMEKASYGGKSPMTFPPLAATVSRAPPTRKSRCARTSTRLNASISGRTGTACSAETTSWASSLPLPSYTNRIRMLHVVSCGSPENVKGAPYASWRMGCFKSSCVLARW